MYFVYIIKCKDGSLYTGITTDVNRRFEEHKKGIGSRYTKVRGVEKVIHIEKKRNRSTASKREVVIKRMSREEKFKLVR